MSQNKMSTVNDVPDDWGWYFEMSLLETVQFKFSDELFVDYYSNSKYISIWTHTVFSRDPKVERELVPIVYHGKAKIK